MQRKILFCSSFIDNAQTGAAIFAQLFLIWAEDRGILVDIITPEKTQRKKISLVRSNRIYRRIPILQNYHISYIYYKTVQAQIAKNDYEAIFFNSVTESLHTAKLVKDTPVYGFQHDENFMNDYKENPSAKRKFYRNAMHKHERSASQFLDKVLTNSLFMKSQIEKVYGLHPLKVAYTYFRSYDLDVVKTKETRNTSKTEILFVKHDYERGGLLFLAEALRKISEDDFVVKIVGVPASKKKAIAKIMHGIEHEVLASRSRVEIASDYRNCDIFCVPSQSEALGLANMEAMFFEKPVVAFDIPVIRELNRANRIISIARFRDTDDLALKIKNCIDKGSETREQIRQAKSFIEKSISKEVFYKNLDHFFSH